MRIKCRKQRIRQEDLIFHSGSALLWPQSAMTFVIDELPLLQGGLPESLNLSSVSYNVSIILSFDRNKSVIRESCQQCFKIIGRLSFKRKRNNCSPFLTLGLAFGKKRRKDLSTMNDIDRIWLGGSFFFNTTSFNQCSSFKFLYLLLFVTSWILALSPSLDEIDFVFQPRYAPSKPKFFVSKY